MGLEDETISQKIKVFKINIEKQISIKNKTIDEKNNDKLNKLKTNFFIVLFL